MALLAYWANILIAGIALGWSLWHIRSPALLRDRHAEVVTLLRRRLVVAQLLYFFGATLCVFNPYWSIGYIWRRNGVPRPGIQKRPPPSHERPGTAKRIATVRQLEPA